MSLSSHTDLYRSALVVDATAPMPPFGPFASEVGPAERVDVYAAAGVTLAVFTIVDDYPNSIEQTIKLIALNRRYFLNQPKHYILANTVADVHQAKREGKLAVGLAFQGSNALMGEVALVELYRRLGVIQMLLAYNMGSLAADGCHESRNGGLTHFGRDLIAEMNRVGMVLDVTHVGLRSSLEALELTTKPAVFSHSTPRKFAPHDRNIADEQIRACAAKDGVICLSGVGLFMDAKNGRASVSRLVDTIEYVCQLVGPRHAGIGLDFIIDTGYLSRFIRDNAAVYGGGSQYPENGKIDFAPPSMLCEVSMELIRRGYPEDDVHGILGGNYLRVLEANR